MLLITMKTFHYFYKTLVGGRIFVYVLSTSIYKVHVGSFLTYLFIKFFFAWCKQVVCWKVGKFNEIILKKNCAYLYLM